MTDEVKRGPRPLEAEEKALLAAKAEQVRVETEIARAGLRSATALAEMHGFERDAKQRAVDEIAAKDFYHQVYRFNGEVTEKSVATLTYNLNQWDRRFPDKGFTIIFNSPGGSVVPGMALYDEIRQVSRAGHKITTVAQGYAASMGGILLQAGDHRVIGREAWVLIHEVSGGMMGSFGDMEDRMEWLKRVQDRILDIFAERSDGKKSRAQFERAWKRKDFWLDAEDCLKWGVVDEIR